MSLSYVHHRSLPTLGGDGGSSNSGGTSSPGAAAGQDPNVCLFI